MTNRLKSIAIPPQYETTLVALVLALKLFSDMFYTIILFDAILLGVICLFLGYTLLHKTIALTVPDYLIFGMMLLFAISTLKYPAGFFDGIKIESAFLLYFVGRFYAHAFEQCAKYLFVAVNIILVLNIIYIALGHGQIQWGNAITLNGFYYFKTDLALFLSYYIVFTLMYKQLHPVLKALGVSVALVLTLFANARIYYAIVVVLLLLFFWYKTNQTLRITFKKLLPIGISGVLVIVFLNNLSAIPALKKYNLLGLEDVHSISDLFTRTNSQSRNEIWAAIITPFLEQPILTKLFGAHILFGPTVSTIDDHSMYLKVLVCTGFVGLLVFFTFLVYVYIACCNTSKAKPALAFTTAMLVSILGLAGYSTSVIAFTANTWLVFFAIGATQTCATAQKLADTADADAEPQAPANPT